MTLAVDTHPCLSIPHRKKNLLYSTRNKTKRENYIDGDLVLQVSRIYPQLRSMRQLLRQKTITIKVLSREREREREMAIWRTRDRSWLEHLSEPRRVVNKSIIILSSIGTILDNALGNICHLEHWKAWKSYRRSFLVSMFRNLWLINAREWKTKDENERSRDRYIQWEDIS